MSIEGRPDASGAGFVYKGKLLKDTRSPIVDEMISQVNPLVAQTAAELRGLTNGAGIKPFDLDLYRLLLDRRMADLRGGLDSVNFETDIFEGEIPDRASEGKVSETPVKTWPVLMVVGSLGEQLPSVPRISPSQTSLEALISRNMGDRSFASFAVLTDQVKSRRYTIGSFVTIPVITINSGKIKETSYRVRLH